MIAKRLPLYLQNRSTKTEYELAMQNGKIDISDLIRCITKDEAEKNDPMFGNITELVTLNVIRNSSIIRVQFY